MNIGANKSASLLPQVTLFAGLTVIDQGSKRLAQIRLEHAPGYRFLNDSFRLLYAENRGGFLSFGAELSDGLRFALFVVFSTIGLAALGWLAWKSRDQGARYVTGLTLILAGGASNLFDRITHGGKVIDFMNVGIGTLRTGVFNIADMAILAGTGWLLWQHGRRRSKLSADIKEGMSNEASDPE